MKSASGNLRRMCSPRVWAILLAGMAFVSVGQAQQFSAGDKAKVKGEIISRSGDKLKIQDSKTGSPAVVMITDDTKILRDKTKFAFRRHENMDVTAMVPGLTISAEGVGNASGGLDANKITFSPDMFAIEVAQEQQIIANKAAAAGAQSTANQGVAAADAAQSSANQAQTSADQAGATAQAAGTIAVMNSAAVQKVNRRVSDLDDYYTVAAAIIYYPTGQSTLDAPAKADLDKLAFNQQLSEDRAATVANYLRSQGNIPMRRIVAPAGYGSTHPDATNDDPQGRELNRRVDVKLIVNKGVQGT
jgi:outer membrane protein OmpA-like peptidoglycan-associated protein